MVIKPYFWKICDWFFFLQKLNQKNFEIQFFQKISNTIILFDSKYEFRMISAFIWYAYCPYRWKNIIFQTSAYQKLKNFSVKLDQFGVALRKYYGSRDVAQSFYRFMKMPRFIWDHVLTDLGEKSAVETRKVLWADFPPPLPQPVDWPSPAWLGLRIS